MNNCQTNVLSLDNEIECCSVIDSVQNCFDNQGPVLLLMGGVSSERDISFQSGMCVEKALIELGYKVISFDTALGLSKLIDLVQKEKPCCIFNALHGSWGENGSFQGLFNILQIPYTHSGVLASSLAMNKQEAKKHAECIGIDTPKGKLLSARNIKKMVTTSFDCVIKPNQEGSSVGVFIVKEGEQIPELFQTMPDDKIFLVEEYIPGREFSVAATDEGALGIIEIVPKNGFYDYEHKYSEGLTDHVVPTDLSLQLKNKLLDEAFLIHKSFGCKGVSRCDFRYDPQSGRLVFLEINANPGMTKLSLVPEMALQKGISYNELVNFLIKKADFEK